VVLPACDACPCLRGSLHEKTVHDGGYECALSHVDSHAM
jgi:hypothetical protein